MTSLFVKLIFILLLLANGLPCCVSGQGAGHTLQSLSSPVLFKGNEHTAYRDPAVLYHNHYFFLFFTLVEIEPDGRIYSYTALSRSKDLVNWTSVKRLTPKDQRLNYSSPGNVVRFNGEWILCLQTYPRPEYRLGKKIMYGTADARIFIIRSRDLENWSDPEPIMVKGNIPVSDMGRMIDPYLLEDKDEPGKWWCFYKQNGVSMSYSYDLKQWTYFGHNNEVGENCAVITENDRYILFHSPHNGIGIKVSEDIKHWRDYGTLLTLGQQNWEWARGRITGGTVIDLRHVPSIGRYVMFFHGSGPLSETEGDFDKNASIGIAWSDNLISWLWPAGNP